VGCSTASQHPELVAKAAQVRVVQDSAAVDGCTFLRAVTGTEEPGYVSRAGIVYDRGTPAITMLQIAAQFYGADTVQVTSSTQTYSANTTKAQTLTTMTGNAYWCAARKKPAATVAAIQPNTAQADVETEKGNATVRIRLTYRVNPDGTTVPIPQQEWFTVDADIQGNHVLAYYDWSLHDQRIPLEGCWLDEKQLGQCRQRDTEGLLAIVEVDGRDLRQHH
jgi:hypothetical protein